MEFEEIISKRSNKTIYKNGKQTIKVFNEDFSKADILNEALNLARVEETGLKICKLKEVKMIEGKWALVLDYIEGESLSELMEKHPEKEDEYLNLFVELQMEVHSKRCPLLNKIKDKMIRKMKEADISEDIRYNLLSRLEGMPTHEKVCHGDFNPSNIIVTPEGELFIIDWSHVTQGNASADVARTYLLFNLNGKKELADKYLNLFCEKSNTEKKYIQKWMPIVAASQSVKGKKEEREFLLNWANITDYE